MRLNRKHKQRVFVIALSLVLLGASLGLVLYALRQNINVFYTPSQLLEQSTQPPQTVRLGGLVLPDSVKREATSADIDFTLSDGKRQVQVHYRGVLPNLFREGQGIIAEGRMQPEGFFQATRVLAKHDENYRPPMALSKEAT